MKSPNDLNQSRDEIVRRSTEVPVMQDNPVPWSISQYLAKIGQRGGLKGGKARAKKLSAEYRSEIARNAARERWRSS